MAFHSSEPGRRGVLRRLLPTFVGRPAGVALFLSMAVAGALAAFVSPVQAQYAPKEQTRLDITVTAAADVNRDDKERAAPVMVRVYELKSGNAFEAADYFSLHDNEKTVLAADLLARDEFILRPGEVKTIRRKSHPDITAIGVLAGYRDLPNATWRAVHQLPPAPEAAWYRAVVPAPKAKLQIQLEAQGIRLTPVE